MSVLCPLLYLSYKLWYRYLKARRAQVKHRCVTDPAYEDVNNCHERAFVFMHKVRSRLGGDSGLRDPRRWAEQGLGSTQERQRTAVLLLLGTSHGGGLSPKTGTSVQCCVYAPVQRDCKTLVLEARLWGVGLRPTWLSLPTLPDASSVARLLPVPDGSGTSHTHSPYF